MSLRGKHLIRSCTLSSFLTVVYPHLQEIKLGDQPIIRGLFERAICLELPAKKMKFLFKKYLEYEKEHGDEASIEKVKKAAMEYVESKLT